MKRAHMPQRRFSFWFFAVILAFVLASILLAGAASVRSTISRLDPNYGRPDDLITAYGEHLGANNVADLSLTDERCYALVNITEQSETTIRFRIPSMLEKGDYKVLIHPVGRYTTSIEQRVTLTVK